MARQLKGILVNKPRVDPVSFLDRRREWLQ